MVLNFNYKFKRNHILWKQLLIISCFALSGKVSFAEYIGSSDVVTVASGGNKPTPWTISENLDIDGTLVIGTGDSDPGVVNLNATFIAGINSSANISVSGANISTQYY